MGQRGWNEKQLPYDLPQEDGTNGQLLQTDGNGNVEWASVARTIFGNTFTTADEYVLFQIPTAFTISSWTISSTNDSNQSAEFDILTGDTASIASASSITASAKPTMTTAKSATSSTLTGWTTTITAGKWVFVKLLSITGDGVNIQVGGTI